MPAVDWFKADKKLPGGPKILRIAELTGLDADTILGRMWRFWSWVDDHVKEDGRLGVRNVTLLSQLFPWDVTFWRALMCAEVRWLGEDSEGIFIPEFEKWFGQSRRERSANRERQQRYRDTHRNGNKRVMRNTKKPLRNEGDETRRDETRRDETRVDLDSNSSGGPDSLRASAPSVVQAPTDADAGADAVAHKKIDWGRARTTAEHFASKLKLPALKRLKTPDSDLLLKCGALTQVWSERHVADAVEGTQAQYAKPSGERPKIHPCGYLQGTLASVCQERGENFNAHLASITIPDGLLEEPAAIGEVLRGMIGGDP